jgi:hypothetical protein
MTDVVTTKTINELVIEIPGNQIISPTIPVDITIGEAGKLHQNTMEDIVELLARGLSEESIHQLIPRAKFLQNTQSALTSTEQWEAKIDEGRLLQRELKNDFQFAYRKHSDILKKLKNIVDGNGNMDLIQDLSDYPAFANQHSEPLTAILFDTTKTERAKQIALIW